VPQIVVLIAMIAAEDAIDADASPFAALACYLLLLFLLRRAIPKHHRRGMALLRRERFAEAIPEFRRSYDFFTKHRWLDRWRAITMLSSSRIAYREMALLNVAFCLSQIGRRDDACAEYARVLSEFPESKIAQAALRMLEPQ
jgi:tetratricopeptide (TPR) repeat protein